jgi:anaerobic selenocysteine-containing dehydrogenase
VVILLTVQLIVLPREKEMAESEKRTGGEVKTVLCNFSWCGVHYGANAGMVDIQDGKMLRIRPARYYEKYTKEEVKPWVMKARGKTFEPSDKSLVPPLALAYKKRVYSPARIRYPMKRVDFDPQGERNIQNRGVSPFERISWDEALDMITSEMLRIKETYGPTAILYQNDPRFSQCLSLPNGSSTIGEKTSRCGTLLIDNDFSACRL